MTIYYNYFNVLLKLRGQKMRFDDKDLLLAQKEGIISAEVFTELIDFLSRLRNDKKLETVETVLIEAHTKVKFTLENFLYYLGAFIIIITMGWYMANVYNTFGHSGIFILSIIYFIIFTFVGNLLWKKNKTTPGGLLYVCAVSIIPLTIWSFENMIGLLPSDYERYSGFHIWVRSGYIFMELATIFAGYIFLKFRKFPLLTLPICYALWYLSMDIVPLCLGGVQAPSWGMRNFATIVFALVMLGVAMKIDGKTKGDYSGWLYIFASTMLWCAFISVTCQFKWFNEINYLLFALFSIAYMFVSIIIKRKVFMVWGAIGFLGYLSHLTYTVFKDSPIFPLLLVFIGLAIIFAGIYYAKNCDKIEQKLRNLIFK